MDRCLFGKLVVHDQADPLSLKRLDSRAGHAAVKSPDVHLIAGQEFTLANLESYRENRESWPIVLESLQDFFTTRDSGSLPPE